MVTSSSPPGSAPDPGRLTRDRGATIVEYGVTVSVIAFVAMAGVKLFGDRLAELITNMTSW
jgi:Flp pilus assembly pilin Flp